MKEGIVLKSTGSRYIVTDTEGNTFHCVIKGKFRIDGYKTTNPVTVGDHVFFRETQGSSDYLITKIRERKNYIIRKSSNLSKQYHIIAANIDQALLIVTLKFPETQSEFIDRYLITAEAYSIPAILVFNKIDIYEEVHLKKMEELISIYSKIGYPCVSISAKQGTNIEELKSILKNKTSLFSGNSGVGKSSIINEVDKNIKLKTNEISSYHKTGKHTTTFAEMHRLTEGGYIIDTPGIRGFGIIDFARDELYHYFPEIFKYSAMCKYHNCLHLNEPDCAVKKAVEAKNISEMRYMNYMKILFDDDEKYR